MLDVKHGMIQEKDALDQNSYHAGQIHNHNIVIVCLPDGEYGTNAAATVAANMLRTFKNLKIGMMVGIGGGLPNTIPGTPGYDLRLGDVVVSSAKSTTGGVVQFDLGKVTHGTQQQSQTFIRKGTLNRPPLVMRNALSCLRACHQIGESKIPEILQKVFDNSRLKRTFGHPGSEHDRLFHASFVHPTASNIHSDCSTCDASHVVAREVRPETWPEIFYGTVLSGNCVIKHSAERDGLRDLFAADEALCVEMEAAGLMNSFPCIVIRGICDYADSHKNDVWHGYAAITAAAFAKDLLSYVSAKSVESEGIIKLSTVSDLIQGHLEPVQNHINHHLSEVARERSQQSEKNLQAELENCHKELHPGTSYEESKNIVPSRAPGTCKWVLNDDKYVAWAQNSRNDLLWISADPGCGKSVLAKALVDEIFEKQRSQTICYFFFRNSTGQDSLSVALCAILHQLFDQQQDLREHALSAFKKLKGSQIRQETDTLWRMLMEAARDTNAQSITCVMDALDEADARSRGSLIQKLCEFYHEVRSGSSVAGRLKFIVTSRPYDEVQDEFDRISESLPKIRLRGEDKNHEIADEINLVIKHRVQEVTQRCKLSVCLGQRLEAQLLGMQNRTYLWLYLAIDDIIKTYRSSSDPESVVIEPLPQSVDEAYERILQRVDRRVQAKVKNILYIIVGARRPLSIGELCIALEISNSDESLGPKNLQMDFKAMEDKIRQWCGLFVFFRDDKVYLIHQTAKDFLVKQESPEISSRGTWKHSVDYMDTQNLMTIICLRFMRHLLRWTSKDSLDLPGPRPSSLSGAEVGNGDAKFSDYMNHFYQYTLNWWFYHVHRTDISSISCLWKDVLSFYDDLSATRRNERASWVINDFYPELGYASCHAEQELVCVAILAGHTFVLDQMQAAWGFDFLKIHPVRLSPLTFAARLGYMDAVRWLISNKADFNSVVGVKAAAAMAPLHVASARGNASVVKYLLAAGADADVLCERYGTPLNAAIMNGHLDVVAILIETGTNLEIISGPDGSHLHSAITSRRLSMVDALIQAGADTNIFADDWTPLQCACFRGDAGIIETLLRANAQVNAPAGKYGTSLQISIEASDSPIFQLLIDEGADINVSSETHGSAMETAAELERMAMLRKLITLGAEVWPECFIEFPPLYHVATAENVDILGFLLANKVDVNHVVLIRHRQSKKNQRSFRDTTLHLAISQGHIERAKCLLAMGADPSIEAEGFGTAKEMAESLGYPDLVYLFRDFQSTRYIVNDDLKHIRVLRKRILDAKTLEEEQMEKRKRAALAAKWDEFTLSDYEHDYLESASGSQDEDNWDDIEDDDQDS